MKNIIAATAAFFMLIGAAAADISVKEAVSSLSSSTVVLESNGSKVCTASKIGPSTYITAGHCIWGATDSKFRINKDYDYHYVKSVTFSVLSNNDGASYEDWAILNTSSDNKDRPALVVSCEDEPRLGLPVATMGYPNPAKKEVFGMGYISSIGSIDSYSSNTEIIVDVPGNPGASGSPIISMESGKVVGILIEIAVGHAIGSTMTGITSIDTVGLCPEKEKKEEDKAVEMDSSTYNHSSPF